MHDTLYNVQTNLMPLIYPRQHRIPRRGLLFDKAGRVAGPIADQIGSAVGRNLIYHFFPLWGDTVNHRCRRLHQGHIGWIYLLTLGVPLPSDCLGQRTGRQTQMRLCWSFDHPTIKKNGVTPAFFLRRHPIVKAFHRRSFFHLNQTVVWLITDTHKKSRIDFLLSSIHQAVSIMSSKSSTRSISRSAPPSVSSSAS